MRPPSPASTPRARPPSRCSPDERLDLDAAIAAHTIGAAHACGLDAVTGSIEPGKLADLVVLDRDLYGLEPRDYLGARVLATLVEGEVVYAAPESELSLST